MIKKNGRSHDTAEIIMEINFFIVTSEVAVLFINSTRRGKDRPRGILLRRGQI